MPTDGYVIVDVDDGEGKVGCESLAALEAEYGELPETLVQTTPRGGKHHFFMPPEGTTVRNSQSVLGKDIDVRAEGGYIVLSPSKGANGGSYQWASDPDATQIAEAPDWIVRLATAKPEPSKVANAVIVEAPNWNVRMLNSMPKGAKTATVLGPYEKTIVDAMFAEMRGTEEGSRNGTLFNLTFKTAKMVRVNILPFDVFEGLRLAALDTGLPLDEVDRTMQSALGTALQRGSKDKSPVNTEHSAAVEFVAKYGADTRYCPGLGWLRYSEKNRVWEKGKTHVVLEDIRHICSSVAEKEGNATFGAARTFKGVLQIAQNDPAIYTEPDQWDSNPWLLGTPSSVVCLNGGSYQFAIKTLYV